MAGKRHLLPVMGWNSYCNCDGSVTEEIVTGAADALVDLGLAEVEARLHYMTGGYYIPAVHKNDKTI